MTRDDIDNAVLVLENDGEFYRSFRTLYIYGAKQDAADARNLIQRHLRRLNLREGSIQDRESMRLYFEDRYNLETKYSAVKTPTFDLVGPKAKKASQPTTATVANVDNIDTLVAAVRSKLQTIFPEHKAMNTTILTLTTKHYINGTDISTLSNSQLYQMIAQQEASIKDLEAIVKKPNSLTKEIADRKASIDTLVAFLNDRDAKTA